MMKRTIIKLSALLVLVPALAMAEASDCAITSTDSEISLFQKFAEGTDFECQADGSLKVISQGLATCERKDYYPLIAYCISSQLNSCNDYAFSLEGNIFELNSELADFKSNSNSKKLAEENIALKRKLKRLQLKLKNLQN